MIRSLYTAGTNMIVQRKRMDVITNNIANVDTAGYKSDKLLSRSFEDMLLERVGDPAVISRRYDVGPLNTGIHIDEVVTDFTQGAVQETGRPTDVALMSEGFFVISTPEGERYTRDGSFSRNAEGYLVNSAGNNIVGEDGNNIQIPIGTEFSIDQHGSILDEDGNSVGKLRVVTFEDHAALRKEGNNNYINFTNAAVENVEGYEVRAGYLEASNSQMAIEMIDMMQTYRTYETNQRVVKMLDDTLQKTVNVVGRVG